MVKVWVVGHPHRGRRWCEVRVRSFGEDGWKEGFVWAEWTAPTSENPIVPCLPSVASSPFSNVDPLAFGPRMYFDYCLKGKCGRNLEPPNSLVAGDLVVFASRDKHRIWIDTVFAIGATRQWPQTPGSIPAWGEVGVIAERVHFHPHALQQHPEVYDQDPPARSYRGALDRDELTRYAWVPWSHSPNEPFQLSCNSDAFTTLEQIYPNMNIMEGFRGSFAVTETTEELAQQLFDELIELAHAQGFGIAAEVALVDYEEITYDVAGDGCEVASDDFDECGELVD